MSRGERRNTPVTWGPRRVQSFVGKIKNFSKVVSGLSERVSDLADRAVPPPPQTDAEEALTVLQLEHEALLVAEEELRAQLEELEAGHVLVQAERRRFEHMFEGAPDGYVITDGYGTIQELNPMMAKLLGGVPRSYVRKPLSLYVEERHRRGLRDFLSTLGSEPSAELEIAVMGPEARSVACAVAVSRMPLPSSGNEDGTLFWRFRRMPASEERATRVSTLPPPPSSSVPDAAAVELERRWSRERAARERLELEIKGKDRLLAMVSHDLRAPLHAMLSWAHLVRKNGSDEALRCQALAAIERSGRTQVALLEDLLDVSRIAEGKLTVDRVPLDLSATVRFALEALVPRARDAGIELSWQLADGVTMSGDATRLQQVVTNLVSNALKFTRRGGAVYVSLERDGVDAVLRVRDTGKGIAREALDSVFECFGQEEGRDARDGMGLGLYITRHLVERHGGTIHAYSDGPGTGAVFTTRLPAHEIPLSAPSTVTLPTATLSALNVVVVSDDGETCELLTSGLRRASPHAQVSCASLADVAHGLDERCDVIIVDVPSDSAQCASLARAARSRRDVPLIAISAFASTAEVRAILDAGFDAHLAKPFSADDLTATIRSALPDAAEG